MSSGVSLWLLLTLLASLLLTRAANNPEVSWGDWIIVDETEPGTSILLRRITPKSVFVAPTFNGCSEGYRQDSLGRCVKLVKVNQQAQWNFFLERLNSMYAPSSTSKNPQKEAGPFHINLPIGSESSQVNSVVKKRLPPQLTDETAKTTTTSTTQPITSTTVQEWITPEVTLPTMVDTSEMTSTERETPKIDSTTEIRRDVTTENLFDAVMLGDQPVTTGDFREVENFETPKNHKDHSSQLPEKPFVIIVTNEPTTRTEETTNIPTTPFMPPITEEEGEEYVSESPSTTEVATESTTETSSKYMTESTPRATEYDESFSEIRDIETSTRPTGKYTLSSTGRPKCDPSSLQVRDGVIDSSDCESDETEVVSDEREVANPSVSLPASLPLLEPNTHVRFPSESFVPVRKTQSFVRFPEATNPHEDRPSFWWPSWQFRQHPGIRGWPPSEDQPRDQMIHKQYPIYGHPGHSWSDSLAWRRRFFQRD